MGFVINDYRAIEQLDSGSRSTPAQSYRGEHSGSGLAVAMTVLGVDHCEAAQVALRALPDVQHQHLLPVDDLVQDESRVALICRWPPAGRLAELLARRHRLSALESLTVLIPLASALARLHAAGLRHGDIGPSSIWFDAVGRPMLGAVGVAHVVAAVGDGLPAGIRDLAPEVVRAERRTDDVVTSAADVFSLGSVALRCLAGRPAWPADDPADVLVQSAAGMWPDLPDDAGPPALLTLVRAMLRADPVQRPAAAEVLRKLEALGTPEPVGFGPVPAVEATSRWNGWGATPTPPSPVGRQKSSGKRPGASAPDAAEKDPPSGAQRNTRPGPKVPERTAAQCHLTRAGAGSPGRPEAPSRLARVGIAVLAGLLVAVVAVQVGLWWTGREQPGSPQDSATGVPIAGEVAIQGWLQVVTDLDIARGQALAMADADGLAEVYLAQSEPALADARMIAALAARGWTIRGGVHEITGVSVDPIGGNPPPDPAAASTSTEPVKLVVTDSLPARPILDTAGNQVGQTDARGEEQRILTLTPTAAGYRISAVEPA